MDSLSAPPGIVALLGFVTLRDLENKIKVTDVSQDG